MQIRDNSGYYLIIQNHLSQKINTYTCLTRITRTYNQNTYQYVAKRYQKNTQNMYIYAKFGRTIIA